VFKLEVLKRLEPVAVGGEVCVVHSARAEVCSASSVLDKTGAVMTEAACWTAAAAAMVCVGASRGGAADHTSEQRHPVRLAIKTKHEPRRLALLYEYCSKQNNAWLASIGSQVE